MKKTVEGTHTGFLRQITGKREWWRVDSTWFTQVADEVWEEAGTWSETNYIGRRQGAVAQWVALQSIFEVYARVMVY